MLRIYEKHMGQLVIKHQAFNLKKNISLLNDF
jgi:hypothetical protein